MRRAETSTLPGGQYDPVAGGAADDASRSRTGRVIAVLTALVLVTAGAIVALIYLPAPATREPNHVPALRRVLDEARPPSVTVIDTSDEHVCESLENRARETLQSPLDLDTMENLYGGALTARSWRVHGLLGGGLGAEKRYPWGNATFNLVQNSSGSFDVVAWYSCNTTD